MPEALPSAHTTPSDAHIPKARWYRMGSLLFFSYLVAYIDRTNMSIAAPAMKEELGLSQAQIGVLLSAFFWGYVVSLGAAGWVVNRLGPKRTIVTALLVFGCASMATGVFTGTTQLLMVRAVLGLGEGLVYPAFTVCFVRWFPSWERGRASMVSLITIPISAIVMAPLGGWMISALDYRWMFILQGAPPVIAALLFAWLAADHPEEDSRLSAAERTYVITNRAIGQTERGNLRDVLLNPKVWLFGVIYLLWVIGLYGFGQWLPTLLTELSGSGILTVGWLTAVPYGVAAVGMFLNALYSDRKPQQRTLFVAWPMLLAGVALLISRALESSLSSSLVLLSIACVGVHASFGPWWAWVLSFVPNSHAGTASGLVLAIGNFGGIIGPVLVGVLAGGADVATGYYVLGYPLVVAGLLALLLGLRNKTRRVAPSPARGALGSVSR
ncbi:MFS transporter [Streptomyces sp. NPDC006332]|uniref:MFS transporter n=1 Tax=Streptomyces sp. NPDC006332 TaxID=3155456 RepID=UPI0033BA765E